MFFKEKRIENVNHQNEENNPVNTKIITLTVVMFLLLSCSLYSAPIGSSITSNDFPLSSSWKVALDSDVDALSTDNNLVAIADENNLQVVQVPNVITLWQDSFSILNDSSLRVSNGKVFAVNSSELRAYDGKSGKILWKTMLNVDHGRPEILLITDSKIYLVIKGDWVVQAYEESSGSLLWEAPSSRGGVSVIDNAHDDIVYLLGNEGIQTYKISSGALVWEKATSGITGPGLFVSGILYYYVADSTFPNGSGTVFALDTANNTDLWHTSSIPQANAISIFSQNLIISTDKGIVAVNSLNGDVEWVSNSKDSFQTRAVQIDETIYARAANTNKIYAVDLSSGNTVGYLSGNQTSIESANTYALGVYKANDFLVFPVENTVYGYALK